MTDRERVAVLIDRLKLTSAWVAAAMEPTKPGDPEPEFCPLATVEDAIAALCTPLWLTIPTEVMQGIAPWDGRPTLLNNREWPQAEVGFWMPTWGEWRSGDSALATPTHYAPIPPLPAPPAGEVG